MGRKLFLGALALVSVSAALWVLISAVRADQLTGQVFFAILPLVMLFGLAWRGLTEKRD